MKAKDNLRKILPYNKKLTMQDIRDDYAREFCNGNMGFRIKNQLRGAINQMCNSGEITRIFISYNKYHYVRTFSNTIKV